MVGAYFGLNVDDVGTNCINLHDKKRAINNNITSSQYLRYLYMRKIYFLEINHHTRLL